MGGQWTLLSRALLFKVKSAAGSAVEARNVEDSKEVLVIDYSAEGGQHMYEISMILPCNLSALSQSLRQTKNNQGIEGDLQQ